MESMDSIKQLFVQMHENIDAIHHTIAELADTKAHEEQMEQVELERQKFISDMSAKTAAEEEVRAQEEKELREKREEEERVIAELRRLEDERRIKVDMERKRTREIEDEKRRKEVEERRQQWQTTHKEVNGHLDAEIAKLEEDIAKKMTSGHAFLEELQQKRLSINQQIEDTIMTAKSFPTVPARKRLNSLISTAGEHSNSPLSLPSKADTGDEPEKKSNNDEVVKKPNDEFATPVLPPNIVIEKPETSKLLDSNVSLTPPMNSNEDLSRNIVMPSIAEIISSQPGTESATEIEILAFTDVPLTEDTTEAKDLEPKENVKTVRIDEQSLKDMEIPPAPGDPLRVESSKSLDGPPLNEPLPRADGVEEDPSLKVIATLEINQVIEAANETVGNEGFNEMNSMGLDYSLDESSAPPVPFEENAGHSVSAAEIPSGSSRDITMPNTTPSKPVPIREQRISEEKSREIDSVVLQEPKIEPEKPKTSGFLGKLFGRARASSSVKSLSPSTSKTSLRSEENVPLLDTPLESTDKAYSEPADRLPVNSERHVQAEEAERETSNLASRDATEFEEPELQVRDLDAEMRAKAFTNLQPKDLDSDIQLKVLSNESQAKDFDEVILPKDLDIEIQSRSLDIQVQSEDPATVEPELQIRDLDSENKVKELNSDALESHVPVETAKPEPQLKDLHTEIPSKDLSNNEKAMNFEAGLDELEIQPRNLDATQPDKPDESGGRIDDREDEFHVRDLDDGVQALEVHDKVDQHIKDLDTTQPEELANPEILADTDKGELHIRDLDTETRSVEVDETSDLEVKSGNSLQADSTVENMNSPESQAEVEVLAKVTDTNNDPDLPITEHAEKVEEPEDLGSEFHPRNLDDEPELQIKDLDIIQHSSLSPDLHEKNDELETNSVVKEVEVLESLEKSFDEELKIKDLDAGIHLRDLGLGPELHVKNLDILESPEESEMQGRDLDVEIQPRDLDAEVHSKKLDPEPELEAKNLDDLNFPEKPDMQIRDLDAEIQPRSVDTDIQSQDMVPELKHAETKELASSLKQDIDQDLVESAEEHDELPVNLEAENLKDAESGSRDIHDLELAETVTDPQKTKQDDNDTDIVSKSTVDTSAESCNPAVPVVGEHDLMPETFDTSEENTKVKEAQTENLDTILDDSDARPQPISQNDQVENKPQQHKALELMLEHNATEESVPDLSALLENKKSKSPQVEKFPEPILESEDTTAEDPLESSKHFVDNQDTSVTTERSSPIAFEQTVISEEVAAQDDIALASKDVVENLEPNNQITTISHQESIESHIVEENPVREIDAAEFGSSDLKNSEATEPSGSHNESSGIESQETTSEPRDVDLPTPAEHLHPASINAQLPVLLPTSSAQMDSDIASFKSSTENETHEDVYAQSSEPPHNVTQIEQLEENEAKKFTPELPVSDALVHDDDTIIGDLETIEKVESLVEPELEGLGDTRLIKAISSKEENFSNNEDTTEDLHKTLDVSHIHEENEPHQSMDSESSKNGEPVEIGISAPSSPDENSSSQPENLGAVYDDACGSRTSFVAENSDISTPPSRLTMPTFEAESSSLPTSYFPQVAPKDSSTGGHDPLPQDIDSKPAILTSSTADLNMPTLPSHQLDPEITLPEEHDSMSEDEVQVRDLDSREIISSYFGDSHPESSELHEETQEEARELGAQKLEDTSAIEEVQESEHILVTQTWDPEEDTHTVLGPAKNTESDSCVPKEPTLLEHDLTRAVADEVNGEKSPISREDVEHTKIDAVQDASELGDANHESMNTQRLQEELPINVDTEIYSKSVQESDEFPALIHAPHKDYTGHGIDEDPQSELINSTQEGKISQQGEGESSLAASNLNPSEKPKEVYHGSFDHGNYNVAERSLVEDDISYLNLDDSPKKHESHTTLAYELHEDDFDSPEMLKDELSVHNEKLDDEILAKPVSPSAAVDLKEHGIVDTILHSDTPLVSKTEGAHGERDTSTQIGDDVEHESQSSFSGDQLELTVPASSRMVLSDMDENSDESENLPENENHMSSTRDMSSSHIEAANPSHQEADVSLGHLDSVENVEYPHHEAATDQDLQSHSEIHLITPPPGNTTISESRSLDNTLDTSGNSDHNNNIAHSITTSDGTKPNITTSPPISRLEHDDIPEDDQNSSHRTEQNTNSSSDGFEVSSTHDDQDQIESDYVSVSRPLASAQDLLPAPVEDGFGENEESNFHEESDQEAHDNDHDYEEPQDHDLSSQRRISTMYPIPEDRELSIHENEDYHDIVGHYTRQEGFEYEDDIIELPESTSSPFPRGRRGYEQVQAANSSELFDEHEDYASSPIDRSAFQHERDLSHPSLTLEQFSESDEEESEDEADLKTFADKFQPVGFGRPASWVKPPSANSNRSRGDSDSSMEHVMSESHRDTAFDDLGSSSNHDSPSKSQNVNLKVQSYSQPSDFQVVEPSTDSEDEDAVPHIQSSGENYGVFELSVDDRGRSDLRVAHSNPDSSRSMSPAAYGGLGFPQAYGYSLTQGQPRFNRASPNVSSSRSPGSHSPMLHGANEITPSHERSVAQDDTDSQSELDGPSPFLIKGDYGGFKVPIADPRLRAPLPLQAGYVGFHTPSEIGRSIHAEPEIARELFSGSTTPTAAALNFDHRDSYPNYATTEDLSDHEDAFDSPPARHTSPFEYNENAAFVSNYNSGTEQDELVHAFRGASNALQNVQSSQTDTSFPRRLRSPQYGIASNTVEPLGQGFQENSDSRRSIKFDEFVSDEPKPKTQRLQTGLPAAPPLDQDDDESDPTTPSDTSEVYSDINSHINSNAPVIRSSWHASRPSQEAPLSLLKTPPQTIPIPPKSPHRIPSTFTLEAPPKSPFRTPQKMSQASSQLPDLQGEESTFKLQQSHDEDSHVPRGTQKFTLSPSPRMKESSFAESRQPIGSAASDPFTSPLSRNPISLSPSNSLGTPNKGFSQHRLQQQSAVLGGSQRSDSAMSNRTIRSESLSMKTPESYDAKRDVHFPGSGKVQSPRPSIEETPIKPTLNTANVGNNTETPLSRSELPNVSRKSSSIFQRARAVFESSQATESPSTPPRTLLQPRLDGEEYGIIPKSLDGRPPSPTQRLASRRSTEVRPSAIHGSPGLENSIYNPANPYGVVATPPQIKLRASVSSFGSGSPLSNYIRSTPRNDKPAVPETTTTPRPSSFLNEQGPVLTRKPSSIGQREENSMI